MRADKDATSARGNRKVMNCIPIRTDRRGFLSVFLPD
jgi:hypothetical protein